MKPHSTRATPFIQTAALQFSLSTLSSSLFSVSLVTPTSSHSTGLLHKPALFRISLHTILSSRPISIAVRLILHSSISSSSSMMLQLILLRPLFEFSLKVWLITIGLTVLWILRNKWMVKGLPLTLLFITI